MEASTNVDIGCTVFEIHIESHGTFFTVLFINLLAGSLSKWPSWSCWLWLPEAIFVGIQRLLLALHCSVGAAPPSPRSLLSPSWHSSSHHQQCSREQQSRTIWRSPQEEAPERGLWWDSLWHSWGGQPLTLWRMELIWHCTTGYTAAKTSGKMNFFQSEETASWFAEAQKPWLAWIHGALCQYSVCQANLAHLQPSYNTSSTPKLLHFLICIRCTRSCFVFLRAFPIPWARSRSLCWLSFQVLQHSIRPRSFCLFTEVQFPALLTHTCWQHSWSFLVAVLQIIWLWVFGSLSLLEAFSSRRWACPRSNRPQNFLLTLSKREVRGTEDLGRRELYPKSIDYKEKTHFMVSKLQQYKEMHTFNSKLWPGSCVLSERGLANSFSVLSRQDFLRDSACHLSVTAASACFRYFRGTEVVFFFLRTAVWRIKTERKQLKVERLKIGSL